MRSLAAVHTNRRLRILVVDDNAPAAEALADLLRDSGHLVFTAYDGRAGLHAFDTIEPDLAFLDLRMPGLDGLSLARFVRADTRFRTTPLVALTGCDGAEDRRRVRAAGFDHHLPKPADIGEIERLVATYAA